MKNIPWGLLGFGIAIVCWFGIVAVGTNSIILEFPELFLALLMIVFILGFGVGLYRLISDKK